MERLYPERLIEEVDRLANHAFNGEDWGKSVIYLQKAGVRAAGRSAYREPAEFFERALFAGKNLKPAGSQREQTIEFPFALWNALLPIGDFDRILPHLIEAQKAAEILDDRAQHVS